MTDEIEEKIQKDLKSFKSEIFRKYNVDIHIYFSRYQMMEQTVTMSNLWVVFTEVIQEHYPEHIRLIDLKIKTRKKDWVTILQCFAHIAFNDLGYNKSQIGKFLGKDHATVIHYLNRVEHYTNMKESYFMKTYTLFKDKYTEYVGTL